MGGIISICTGVFVFCGIIFISLWLQHRQWKRDFNKKIKAVLKQNKEWDETFFSRWEQKYGSGVKNENI